MFYADLHLHSKYSRATSRDSDLEHMAIWARKKGVAVLGTGDFTHPQWFDEIKEKLVSAESGLFRLRDDLQREVDRQTADASAEATRFMLQVEISTIYKKADHTRKVHHVIYVPELEKAERLIEKLSRIGNLKSDGRPILGLDSRDLLEITLECGEGCYLIPAHIWTPWFAVLGSKSGFDSVEDCYGDLSSHVFALETGLSSDPAMNWRLSQLDRYSLVSNSDAHSPPKIGREACVFETEIDYFAMLRALETGDGYAGTVEFFPEEGKYHLDGHRKCGVRLSPSETRQCDGICPVCGKNLTVGVMNRVEELADRPDGFEPDGADRFRCFVPLSEVIAEIRAVGEKSKKVQQAYEGLIAKIGSELYILEQAPIEDIRNAGAPVVAEAIARMRSGRVIRDAGYDGEYGTIHLFEKDELTRGAHVSLLFDMPEQTDSEQLPAPSGHDRVRESEARMDAFVKDKNEEQSPSSPNAAESRTGLPTRPDGSGEPSYEMLAPSTDDATKNSNAAGDGNQQVRSTGFSRIAPAEVGTTNLLDDLDLDQRSAAEIVRGPLLIMAGPGTGKTRTLTYRIAHLIADHNVLPEQCLAITFTRRAAGEMTVRLAGLLPDNANPVPVMTFHALGLLILRENASRLGLPSSFRVAGDGERLRLLVERLEMSERKAKRALGQISRAKRDGAANPDTDEGRILRQYQQLLRDEQLVDFDDLIVPPVEMLEADPELAAQYRDRWPWISVDEYQDIDDNQYRLIRQLVLPDGNICAIGDPDQSIYGFRGSNPQVFLRFADDFPTAHTIQLTTNYRSSQTIVDAATQAIAPSSLVDDRALQALSEVAQRIQIQTCPTERAEAEFVVHSIERLIGGSTFFSMDSGRVDTDVGEALSFADVAVLYRTDAQAEALVEAFARSGIPFQKKSHSNLCDEPAVQAMIRHLQDAMRRSGEPYRGETVADLVKQAADAVWDEHSEIAEYLGQLHPLAVRCGDDPGRFLTELAMGMDVDLWDPRADRVSLLTLHASKGLEFPVVFLAGCEDGVLPLRWGDSDDTDVAEERRLFFVGMTRAKEWLFLSHAKKRRWRGKVRELPASPFLQQIQEELLERGQRTSRRKPKRSQDNQLQLF